MPLVKILNDIRNFVKLSNEIIIIDFSEFPVGFYTHPERHSELIRLLERRLGDLVIFRNESTAKSNSYELTLNEFRHNGKFILINYNNDVNTSGN